MGRYIHLFDTQQEFETAYNGANYEEPWVSYVEENEEVGFNKEKPDYTNMPLTIEVLSNGNISWNMLESKTLQYSKNGGSWETMVYDTVIPVSAGDEVRFKGTNSKYYDEGRNLPQSIISTARFNVKGNVMSLTDGDNFKTANAMSTFAFAGLFSECSTLISAENLILPSTALSMCCYLQMFYGCTSLTTAPELPATTLASSCYSFMFSGCTNLNYIKAMFTTTPGGGYTGNWVTGVAAAGTFVKNSAAQWNVSGVNGIPTGWTVQTASA